MEWSKRTTVLRPYSAVIQKLENANNITGKTEAEIEKRG